MRYSAAYLLAVLGGNPSPDAAAIAKILGSVGIEYDEIRAQRVVDACKGKDVNEIIAEGLKKIDTIASTNVSMVTTSNQTLVHTVQSNPIAISDNVEPIDISPPSPSGSDTFGKKADPGGSCGSYWILVDPTGSYWILVDPIGSWWILLDPGGS
ncbi:unnamed protein product [Rotaria sp. Silwood2]|nr:unnamed protein product [Rotaria sp. Silwood2]